MDVAVRDYWFLPADQQVQVRVEVYASVLGVVGHVYRVQGKISTVEYCECEFCEGHSGDIIVIDEMVTGADEQDAAENALRQCSTVGDVDEWIEEGPVVTKLID